MTERDQAISFNGNPLATDQPAAVPSRNERLESVIGQFSTLLYAIAYKLTGDAEDARDLLQDSWERVLEHVDAILPIGEEESYKQHLANIVRRCFIDDKRVRRNNMP